MEPRRSFPWQWMVATLVLVVVVGAIAYWLGANHGGTPQPVGFVHPSRPFAGPGFFGGRGFGGWWLPLLLVLLALVVGVIVAAIARTPGRTETHEEWHRRQHQGGPVEPGQTASTASTTAPSSGDQRESEEAAGHELPPG
jgi:hypothetical protein